MECVDLIVVLVENMQIVVVLPLEDPKVTWPVGGHLPPVKFLHGKHLNASDSFRIKLDKHQQNTYLRVILFGYTHDVFHA